MAKKRPTTKQIAYAKEFVANGGNGTQAAKKAYNVKNDATAGQISYENLRKPEIQELLLESAEQLGITKKSIMEPVALALEAVDEDGRPDIDKRLRGHDRIVKLITGLKDNGLQVNIENAKGIEIVFKDLSLKNVSEHENSTKRSTR